MATNKLIKHFEDDIKMFNREAREDKKMVKKLKKKKPKLSKKTRTAIKKGKQEEKIADVMEEYKEGKLRSGSKKGPKVTNRKQALAIALSEAKRKKKRRKG